MKKLCFLFIICFAISEIQAQVNNPDFETYTSCPYDYSQFDLVEGWLTPTAFKSSDYYNVCSAVYAVSVPANGGGNQAPHSGDGYAGIYLMYPDNIREYIEGSLAVPLTADKCYHVEFYVSAADLYMNTTDAFGIYFSAEMITDDPSITNLPFTAQINNTIGNFPDTSSWTLVSGDFTAAGGEQYFIIGNFNDDANSDVTVINAAGYPGAYAFIEDVTVNACATATEDEVKQVTYLYPNPFTDHFTVSLSDNEPATIMLYSVASQKIHEQHFSGTAEVNTEQLPPGIYLYTIKNYQGAVIQYGKIIKD